MNNAKKRALTFNDVDVRYGDQLLTLSTCNSVFDTGRLIVMGRLLRDGEDPYEGTDNVRKILIYSGRRYIMNGTKRHTIQTPNLKAIRLRQIKDV